MPNYSPPGLRSLLSSAFRYIRSRFGFFFLISLLCMVPFILFHYLWFDIAFPFVPEPDTFAAGVEEQLHYSTVLQREFITWADEHMPLWYFYLYGGLILVSVIRLFGQAVLIKDSIAFFNGSSAAPVRDGFAALGSVFMNRLKVMLWSIGGFLLFIIPGFLVVIKSVFVTMVVVDEGIENQGAMLRSNYIVGDQVLYVFRICGMLFLFQYTVINVFLLSFETLLRPAMSFTTTAEFLQQFFSAGSIAVIVPAAVIGSLLYSLYSVLLTVLYLRLKSRYKTSEAAA